MKDTFVALGLLSAAFALSASVAATPPSVTLPVGDTAFGSVRLQPYENVWRYSATRPDGTVKIQGLWSDRMDPIEKAGRKLLRRVQGMTYVNGLTSSTINVFDPETMAAVSSEIHLTDGTWLKRDFNGMTVTETRGASPADKTGVTTTVTLPQPVFDYWGGMYGTLLAALPLKVGMIGTVPSIAEFDSRFQPASFKVVREENLKAGSMGMVHTFVVESEGSTFWISAKVPYVIKLTIVVPQGVANWDEL